MNRISKAHEVKRSVSDDLADIAIRAIENAEREQARAEKLKRFAQDLSLALADEAMYLESLAKTDGTEPPSDHTLKLLARARSELELEEQFDGLDSLKPLSKSSSG